MLACKLLKNNSFFFCKHVQLGGCGWTLSGHDGYFCQRKRDRAVPLVFLDIHGEQCIKQGSTSAACVLSHFLITGTHTCTHAKKKKNLLQMLILWAGSAAACISFLNSCSALPLVEHTVAALCCWWRLEAGASFNFTGRLDVIFTGYGLLMLLLCCLMNSMPSFCIEFMT